MMSEQVCETQTWTHIMCRLGRPLRSGDEVERRGEEGEAAATTEEARRWDEEPALQTPYC